MGDADQTGSGVSDPALGRGPKQPVFIGKTREFCLRTG